MEKHFANLTLKKWDTLFTSEKLMTRRTIDLVAGAKAEEYLRKWQLDLKLEAHNYFRSCYEIATGNSGDPSPDFCNEKDPLFQEISQTYAYLSLALAKENYGTDPRLIQFALAFSRKFERHMRELFNHCLSEEPEERRKLWEI